MKKEYVLKKLWQYRLAITGKLVHHKSACPTYIYNSLFTSSPRPRVPALNNNLNMFFKVAHRGQKINFKCISVYLVILLAPILFGCSSSDDLFSPSERRESIKGEYIFRKHNEYFYNPQLPIPRDLPIYPWESPLNLPEITKEYFRCKGSCVNPELIVDNEGELKSYFDCEGDDEHGLPLYDGEEYVYSILIDILNYLQEETGHRVIITSGHRCPTHNSYVDSSKDNLYSKHQIGAEVSFYVEGLEYQPNQIVENLLEYYRYDTPEYATFMRYEKSNTNVRTNPWYNKEIFIKLFEPDEGRNLDNKHQYPYISIQVRYDREHSEKVTYSWNRAHRHFLRK